MRLQSYVLRSLWYFRGAGLLVALGVAVATTAIVGALVVDRSVGESVRNAALARIGAADYAIVSPSLFPDDLGARLRTVLPTIHHSSAVLTARGAVQSDAGAVIPAVNVFGVDNSFDAIFPDERPKDLVAGDAVIGDPLARALHVRPGDDLLITVGRNQTVPVDSLFAHRRKDDSTVTMRVTVKHVVPELGSGGFSLGGSSGEPLDLFVSRDWLGAQLGRSGLASILLLGGGNLGEADLDSAMRRVAVLADFGLKVVRPRQPGVLSIESNGLLIPRSVQSAVDTAAGEVRGRTVLTSVFLATTLRCLSKSDHTSRSIPYAVVAALPQTPPVEPWDRPVTAPNRRAARSRPDANGIVLNRWAADALHAMPGDRIEVEALVPRSDGAYATTTFALNLAGVAPMTGLGADPSLTPDFEGITDAKSMSDWKPPFPVDLRRISRRDEDYWNRYRAAPKAFVSPLVAHRYWSIAAGREDAGWVTSVRVLNRDDFALKHLPSALCRAIAPASVGMAWRPVRRIALHAAQGSSDFSGIFLAMGFFVILSGAGLAAMLMRLAVERRSSEMGVLLAIGFGANEVTRIVVAQGAILAAVGAAAGGGPGILYGAAIIRALSAWFAGGQGAVLQPHFDAGVVLAGVFAGLLVGLLALTIVAPRSARPPVRDLLAGWQARAVLAYGAAVGSPAHGGAKMPSNEAPHTTHQATLAWLLLAATAAGVLLSCRQGRPSAAAFFASGVCLLAAGIVCCDLILLRTMRVRRGALTVWRIALRNAAVHRSHSLLAAGIVASSAFLLVTVAANVRDFSHADLSGRDSGSGGFALIATTSVPFALDLGTPAGRERLGFSPEDENLFRGVHVVPLLSHPGDDVSCLNLARPVMPSILGATPEMIARGGFTVLPSRRGELNPWRRLLEPNANSVPAFGDSESVEWTLHSGPGGLYPVTDETPPRYLRFVGLLQSSLFAQDLIVSSDRFRQLFPADAMPAYFLIETSADREASVADALRRNLGPLGMDVRRVRDVLNSVAGVQNAYLASFMALGGLGMLLGTLGLATVLLRSARERQSEFALLLATGFERSDVARILTLETAGLLIGGAVWGALSALVAVAPLLVSAETRVNGGALAGTLSSILVVGLLACIIAANSAARGRLMDALRSE